MQTSIVENFKERALGFWENITQKSNEDEIAGIGRERIIVFIVAFILAVCLWFMVNLSLNYTLNINLPIEKGMMPDDRALTKALPKAATVSISGEGWKLINLYNNPPPVRVDVMNQEVNLYDLVRQQLNTFSEVDVQKVQPLILSLSLEKRSSKKVPVRPVWEISFKNQYGFLGQPTVQPDSITISGAASLLNDISQWPTDTLSGSNIASDITESIDLQQNELLTLSRDKVAFSGEVAQYTEGKATVRLSTRNLPAGQNISYSPTTIAVTFDVPIEEYANIENRQLFEAYINYQQVLEDSTGFVKPNIQNISNNKHVKIRSFQPEEVAYFMVVDN